MTEENKLQEMIRTSLESIRTMVDANTVVGTPIETASGTTIIPISKVSVGYASGGIDFDGKRDAARKNFGGGGGTGLSVQPVCFLAVHAEGSVEVLPLGGDGSTDTVEKLAGLIEKAPDLFAKLRSLFSKKKKSQHESDPVDEVTKQAAEAVEKATEAVEKATEAAEKAEDAAKKAENTAESAEG
ncbi:MAG: sporulation protein YtfJ [Ruminococcaceae bacterium]|nr:sporulation protein YtfJ [Oscillospiraceae bacterium]